MPSRPSTILRKALAIAADPRSPAGERASASRRVAEILAKHPDLAAELHRGSEGKPAAPKAKATPKPRGNGKDRGRRANQSPEADAAAEASEAVRAAAANMNPKTIRKAARVVGKAAGIFGFRRVQASTMGIIDLLDEWERE